MANCKNIRLAFLNQISIMSFEPYERNTGPK
jgi:hypothetical protein